MKITEIIEKKKQGLSLTKEEIFFVVKGAMDGSIADYQLTALFMAIYFKGMNINETTWMTQATVESGTILDLSVIGKNVADKHSSGGVGDKITLIYMPLVAACGVPIAKLSGKGLGHTGGTIDKLNSIPGFNCELELDEFMEKVKNVGLAVASQTHNLTPADGKFYALRDVTSTIDILPLIAVSIVSKKIASGANCIVLDVKCGEGAFVKTIEDAKKLSEMMVEVGKRLNRKICAVITNMNEPLGNAIGNAVEVVEAIEFLKGNCPEDLKTVTFELATQTLLRTGTANSKGEAELMLENTLNSGLALKKLKELIIAQNGNAKVIEDYTLLPQPKKKIEIFSKEEGFVSHIKVLEVAKATKLLGAGRTLKTDPIDYAVGVVLNKKRGEFVKQNELLATLYVDDEKNLGEAVNKIESAFITDTMPPSKNSWIFDIIA